MLLLEEVSGVIEKIAYKNAENDFSVIKIKSGGYKDLITLVGNVSNVSIGSVIRATGTWSMNPKFGRQFNIKICEESLPADVHGIEKYLGSGLIKGIGKSYAKAIVSVFGTETFDIIENSPQRLLEVPKLGQKKVDTIVENWNRQKDIKDLMIFLQKAGVGASYGQKIFKAYGKESIQKIKENPYRLTEEVYLIGFKIADAIAQNLGFEKDSYSRCRAGIFYILENAANSEGHCYLPKNELIERSSKMLGIDDDKLFITLDDLIINKNLIFEDESKVYLPSFYYCEIGIANKIKAIKNFPNFKKYSDEEISENIAHAEEENKISYDDSQKEAIKTAISSNFSVITGGAGVGKTTITKAIISILRHKGKKIMLAAPTGRAAKRMSEATQMESKTIHRLLEAEKGGHFIKNSENKLTGNVLIVDESSMVDLILMHNLLKAVSDSTKVILIGDVNQLPSVGPGNVLKDIINSEFVPTIKLTQIYRQASKSNIILNSHKVNKGEIPDLHVDKNSDFFFIEQNNNEKCAELIVDLCLKRLPRYYNVNPIVDIQVLTPMKKGVLGTDNLNCILQNKLNQSKFCLKRSAIEYRLGDKVMQIKNNYDKDIFNGDIGTIYSIDEKDESLEIKFDSRIIKYDISELEEVSLAYACTIHKSQGGEYPIVIIPISCSHYVMLERNLLYTGITRAKKVCIIVGETKAVTKAVETNDFKKRYTSLSQKLI